MRRENRTNHKKQTNDKFITFGMVGAAILVVAILSVMTFVNKNGKSNRYADLGNNINISNTVAENTESASSELGKTVNEIKEETNTTNTANNTTNTTNTANTATNNVATNVTTKNTTNTATKKNTTTAKPSANTTKQTASISNKEEGPTFMKPVEGEVSKEFAKEQLIYSDTLEEWTTHLGIDIKANETTVVVASEKGTVKSIKNDPRYGLTIIIDHEDGYQTIYSNLLTSEFVVEGEKVEKGQTIATVGNTAAFEIREDAHLHFEILKDYKQVDPSIYIK